MNRSITSRKQKSLPFKREKVKISQSITLRTLNFIQDDRIPRQNNYYDTLVEIQNKLDHTVYEKVTDLIKDQDRIQGVWGAESALLLGFIDTTIFHLRGEGGIKAGGMATPRLLAITGEELEGNQMLCPPAPRCVSETIRLELHQVSPTPEAKERAIDQLTHHLSMVREWDLRPERMLASLKSLGNALRPEDRHDKYLAEQLFGQLSLQALEQLVERWTRHLNPYWEEEKKRVRKRIKAGAFRLKCEKNCKFKEFSYHTW